MNHWTRTLGVIGVLLFWGNMVGAQPIKLVALRASEDMPPKYGVDRAADGLPVTHWAAQNMPPVWIQAFFEEPRWVSRIRLRQCEMTSIYDNARRITISFSDGGAYSCILNDQWQEQVICFPRRKAIWLRLTFESTYKTSHYVGIGEIVVEDEGPEAAARKAVSVTPPVNPKESLQVAQAGGPLPVKTEQAPMKEQEMALIAKLATKPASGPHPTLFMNPQDIERAKENIRRKEWARRVFKGILDGAAQWLQMSDNQLRGIIPPKGAMFDNKAACPICGEPCTASLDLVGKVSCTKCKKSYPDGEHPDDGKGWKDPKTGEITYFVAMYNSYAIDRLDSGIADLSHAYALTGDERYAHALAVLLDALAVIYPTCDKGPIWYPGVGGRLNRPFYQTARTLIYYAREYDLTYNSPEWDKPSCDPAAGTRRANFEKNLLINGAEYCFTEVTKQKTPGLHNGNCDYLQGALAVGRVLGIQKYIDYVLESDLSIFNFIENTIDRDGQYYETSFGYSHWATELFGHHAEMLWNYRSAKYPNGINLYEHPKLRQNYLRAESDIDCAGHQPALGDAGPDLLVVDEEQKDNFVPRVYNRLEILLARTTDLKQKRELQRLLYEYCGGDVEKRRASSNMGRWLLFHAEDVPKPTEEKGAAAAGGTAPRCTLLAGARGIAILRAGEPMSGERCALVRYGPTLNHGSPDEMNINLYALGREITYDQGYGWAHHRCGWAHSTVAHNLVVVNEKNQLLGDGGAGGSLEHFGQSASVRLVAADDPACYSSEGVKRYRRLLALVDLSPERSYVLDIFDVVGGQKHDLSHHFCGVLSEVKGAVLGPPQTSGSLAGPQYEWWKRVQPTGWIAGEKKPFYWNAPPENGYGFLYDVQTATLESPTPQFIWKVGEREPRPSHIFRPAACVCGTSGPEARLLDSIGTFFLRSEKPGDYIDFRVSVETSGEYLVLVKFYKSTHYGTVALKVDGKPLGEPFNAYSPVGYFGDLYSFGKVHLDAGAHVLRFECVGKDPESAGYYFSMKYFALETPDYLDKLGRKQTEGIALTVLAPKDGTFVTAKAKGLARAPVSNYVLVRRAGQELQSRFVSLIEPFVGQMRATALSHPADNPGVIKVSVDDGREDYFFDPPGGVGEIKFHEGEFNGRFGAVLTRSGKTFEALLVGARHLSLGGLSVTAETTEYSGKVIAVDYEKSLVTVDTPLPAALGDGGYLVFFWRNEYSRNAPYFIGAVRPVPGGSELNLAGASLILAHGRVASEISQDGVFANAVPLDRERAYGRKTGTRYFDGKAIRNTRTGELGRIKKVNYIDSSIVIEQNPGLRNGDRFDLLDVQVGDSFTIPAIVALSKNDMGEWVVKANVQLQVK